MRYLFRVLAALAIGWRLCTPVDAQELLPLQQATWTPAPTQWVVAHADGCLEISGTTTDFSCQMRWRDSFTADSMAIDVAWRLGTSGTAPLITSVSFKNSAATCSAIPGTYINDTTDGIAIDKFLCPNLTAPASAFDVKFDAPAELVLVRTTELYGCANPCVAEAANAVITPSANGPMSVTSGPTSAPNELVQSFAYGPWSSFASPSGTTISNTGFGVSSFLTQYQIGATPGTYTNSFTNSNAHSNVLQNIVAFKPNPNPPLSPPAILGQQVFTVFDNQAAGSAVQGGVFAYAGDYSLILSKPTLTTSPGGLLNLNPTANGFTLARTLTPADAGTYPGQLSVTQAGVTVNQPITLIVEPPRTYAGATNCPALPPAAQRAGLTTLVACIEPTAAFYQNLANWMNCTDGTNPPGLLFYPDWPALTCRDLSFPTDANGRQVMRFHWHSTDDINYMRSVGSTASLVKIKATQCPTQGCAQPVQAPIANSYWEWRGASSPVLTDSVYPSPAPDIFAWTNCPAGVANCNDPLRPEYTLVEPDIFECYGCRSYGGGSAFHWWSNKSYGYNAQDAGLAGEAQIASVVPGWSVTQPHSYGYLITTDGVAGIRATSFVDDLKVPENVSLIGRASPGGTMNPYDVGLLPTWDPLGFDDRSIWKQYNYPILWFGGTYGLNTATCQNNAQCKAEGGQPDQITDTHYLAIWSCLEWATDPTCATTRKGLAQ